MLCCGQARCFEKHELLSKSSNSGGKTSRGTQVQNSFHLTEKYVVLSSSCEMPLVKYLKEAEDAEGFEENVESVRLQTKQDQSICCISFCDESNMICTCAFNEVILWKFVQQLKIWVSEKVVQDLGRVSNSAICTRDNCIFVSLELGSEILLIQCVCTSNIDLASTLDINRIEKLAILEKNTESNCWLQNFYVGQQLHIVGLTSGHGVSLRVWQLEDGKLKLKYRSALPIKVLAAADFLTSDDECYIVAFGPDGDCETFVGNKHNGFSILSRFTVESGIDFSNPTGELQIEFRIFTSRFLKLKPAFFENFRADPRESSCLSIANTDKDATFNVDKDEPHCPILLVCLVTSTSITIVNISSGETFLNKKNNELLMGENVIISEAKIHCLDTGGIIFAYQPLMQDSVITCRIKIFESVVPGDSQNGNVSMIASEPVRSKSVLRKRLKSPPKRSMTVARRNLPGFPVIRSKGAVLKRSSFKGFSLSKPQPPDDCKQDSARSVSSSNSSNSNLIRKYAYANEENLRFTEKKGKMLGTPLSPSLNCLRMSFTPDGKVLAAGANLSPLVLFKTRPAFKPISINKAIGKLTSLHFSFNSKYLVLASSDCSTSVMNTKTGKELLKFQFQSKFKEHPHAQFYYMDKFLIQSEDNQLAFYSLRVQEPVWSKFLAGSFPLPCQQITAFAGANQLYSNLIICALSNKTIQVFDANVEDVVSTFKLAHSKNVNCIRINEAPDGPNAMRFCDFFLTCSPSTFDPINLWDLRTGRCVNRIADINSKLFVPNSRPGLSPCGRYIASGLEENTVVIYDVRKINSRVTCMKCPRTTVILDCHFDRLRPMLWCGSSNGDIWNFKTV